MFLDTAKKRKPSEMITTYPAHIVWDEVNEEYIGTFHWDGMIIAYGRDKSVGQLKERMRRQGWTQFVDEYKGESKVKLVPKIKVIKSKFKEKPKPTQLGRWKHDINDWIYKVGQYEADVYENHSGWWIHLLGTGVFLQKIGRFGQDIEGWHTMSEAMSHAQQLVDKLHTEYVPKQPTQFEIGDIVEASDTNWHHEQGTILEIEDVQDRDGIGGAHSYRIYNCEGQWHRNGDVCELGTYV